MTDRFCMTFFFLLGTWMITIPSACYSPGELLCIVTYYEVGVALINC
jgi:hypothetical protein